MNDKVPCRVSAELRLHQMAQDQFVPVTFDEFIDEHLGAILPHEMCRPVQKLLITLKQIEDIGGSFGTSTLDRSKAIDWLLPDLQAMREACAQLFRDNQ